jgi:hypothetical protein
MFEPNPWANMAGMQIVIDLDGWEPPQGKLSLRAGPGGEDLLAVGFAGWLGLVGRLHELLGRADQPLEVRPRTG